MTDFLTENIRLNLLPEKMGMIYTQFKKLFELLQLIMFCRVVFWVVFVFALYGSVSGQKPPDCFHQQPRAAFLFIARQLVFPEIKGIFVAIR
jgi:Na+/proline symporter